MVLTGRVTGRSFVYAESAIATDRLPARCRSRWRRAGTRSAECCSTTSSPCAGISFPAPWWPGMPSRTGGNLLDDVVLARRYRLIVDGTPAMVISEWFLPRR